MLTALPPIRRVARRRPMPPPFAAPPALADADLAAAHAVARHLPGRVVQIEPLGGGRNAVFRLRFADGARRVLKVAGRSGRGRDGSGELPHSMLREPAVLDLLARRGLPVPRAERADLDGRTVGRPWLVLSDAGRRTAADPAGLSPANRRALFAECGRLLALVHQVAFDRPADFRGGELVEADFARSPLEAWHRRAWDRAASLRLVGPRPEESAPAGGIVPRPAAGFALCHGDFNPAQCVRRGPRVTAVVDWESAHVGDPAYDLAAFEVMLRVSVPAELAEAALAGYGEVRPVAEAERERYRPVRAAHAAALALLFHRRRRNGPMRAARTLAARLAA